SAIGEPKREVPLGFEPHGSTRSTERLESACAVKRRRFPVGARPTPRFAPAGSNRSSHGGNEMAEAFEQRSRLGDRASVQAATRVNAEQASKRSMCRPTRPPNRGRLLRLGEMSEDYAQPLHRGTGGSMYTRKAHATREAPMRDQG